MAEDKYGSRLSPETRMMTGEQLLDALKANLRHEDNPRVAAAEALRDAGVKGIRYLDADSRRRGAGTYNYVVFDPTALNIVRRYGIGALLGGGAAAAAGDEQSAKPHPRRSTMTCCSARRPISGNRCCRPTSPRSRTCMA